MLFCTKSSRSLYTGFSAATQLAQGPRTILKCNILNKKLSEQQYMSFVTKINWRKRDFCSNMDLETAVIRYQWVNACFRTPGKCILIKHDTYLSCKYETECCKMNTQHLSRNVIQQFQWHTCKDIVITIVIFLKSIIFKKFCNLKQQMYLCTHAAFIQGFSINFSLKGTLKGCSSINIFRLLHNVDHERN